MTTDVIQVEDLDEDGNVITTKMVQLQEIDTASTRDQILHAIKTSKWIINELSVLYIFLLLFSRIQKHACTGTWHKTSFTNGDIVQLVAMIKENHDDVNSHQDVLYDIVTSKFTTSMEKKKLFRKAFNVHMQARSQVHPRKSRRHPSRTTGEKSSKCISVCTACAWKF